MKPTAKNIAEYVNKRLDKTKSDNISVCLPRLNKNTIKALRRRFKSVKYGAFGYIEFRR